jgi:DNA adenine methylase
VKITTLLPWYGSNRSLAHAVGRQLAGVPHVTVPFAGGMSELAHIPARTIVASDAHRHVINLANVLADERMGPVLIRRLRRLAFHEDTLREAQGACRAIEAGGNALSPIDWAEDYFVCAWMTRSGAAGTGGEFRGALSVRHGAGGGDSATRFRSAVEALRDWRRVLRRCTFVVRDCFAALADVRDEPECAVYCDSPFPDAGDKYQFRFTDAQHRELAARLAAFRLCRVVARFYRHPLVEELYPAPHWRWLDLTGGKTQANKAAPEVLLVNGDPIHEPSQEM